MELRLPLAARTAEAEAALEMWETITAPLTKRKEDQRRHKGLGEDVALFRADVERSFPNSERARRLTRQSKKSFVISRPNSTPRRALFKKAPSSRAALMSFKPGLRIRKNSSAPRILCSTG